ncbi:hypothetical protein SNEBB_006575 [Seison nebaliae]|nr:hypothetical protein SNEBB_006575 [Seison nebaliae]
MMKWSKYLQDIPKRKIAVNGPSLKDFLKEKKHSHLQLKQDESGKNKRLRIPPWLRTNIPVGGNYAKIKEQLRSKKLATVCEEAKCPNISECWMGKDNELPTATIMIMGDECTRACRFCSVKTNKRPPPLDEDEPENVGETISKWKEIGYIVLTSVTRDDLKDFGSNHFVKTIQSIKRYKPEIKVECLTPDFNGNESSIKEVVNSGLDVFAHNIETVKSLTWLVRDVRANYEQSLKVLQLGKKFNPNILTKTSIMLGCGENDDEIEKTLIDLKENDVDVVTFGQYMQPTKRHLKVKEYVTPEKFDYWKSVANSMNFAYCASGPLVRSSYRAGEYYLKYLIDKKKMN